MSWLGALFGSRAAGSVAEADKYDAALVREDVGRLDTVRAGLGDQVVQYICQGDNDSVLLTLGQLKKEVNEVLHGRHWSSGGRWVSGRADFLLAAKAWRPDGLRRYGEVLAPVYESGWPKLLGSERSPMWFRALLRMYGEARQVVINETKWKKAPPARAKEPWTIDKLKSLLGEDETPILDMAFERDTGWQAQYTEQQTPERMPGFEEHLRCDPERRMRELRTLGAKARAYGLRLLARLDLTDGAFFDFAFDQSGDPAKSAREAAATLLRIASPAALVQRARERWPGLKPAHKVEVARVIAAAGSGEGPALLNQLSEAEKSESVRAEITRLLGQDVVAAKTGARSLEARPDGPDGYTAIDGTWIAGPPRAPLPEDKPVSGALRMLIDEAVAAWRSDDERYNREQRGQKFFRERQPVAASATDRFCQLVGPGGDKIKRTPSDRTVLNIFNLWGLSKERLAIQTKILAHADLTLWHLVRTMPDHGVRGRPHPETIFGAGPFVDALRTRLGKGGDLYTYCDVFAALDVPEDSCMRFLLEATHMRLDFEDWQGEQLWPYFMRHLALIDEALGLAAPSGEAVLLELRALDILAAFPKTPARYGAALLDRATGDRKLVRESSRELLAAAPSLAELLIPLLKHPKSETRAGAARWLAERREAQAIAPLIEAARKEKLAPPKAAMLGAISRLGGDIGEFVAARALLAEAEKGLKKTPAKGLEWFPFDAMPSLQQADGTALDPKVVRWWIVLAAKLKEPGGNAWFELLLDRLEPAAAAKLGLAVMQAWIAYDTAAPSDLEANAHAEQHVDATLKQYQRWKADTTREQIFAMLRQQKLHSYFNSGNDQKGVLALSARASASDAVALAKAFLREHYTRTAQCKALLECLAANPSPVAIQYVLTIAKRWRTRGVQELAGELVGSIAERRGWTAEELADRTIPTGGLDNAGVLELPVGEKIYTARLAADGKITLVNPDGKSVQGLPATDGDAAEALKESKALLATARKEVKQVFEFQSRRLYEALCVGREWPAADWEEFLLQHPLMGRLLQRLLWMGLDETGHRVALFRPMEDLTLTDAADKPVALAAFARIRLAHQTALSSDEVAAWQAHLKDYEVAPLFDQLGRERLLADGIETQTEILDRRGWLIEAFKFRSIATKLGYNRGRAEDGGWFFTYEKAFDGLQLVAVVEFTGNSLPEENRTSALLALRFVKMRRGFLRWNIGVPLGSVSPVLLGEAWNDLHAMAATGSGFEVDWEKKVAW